MNSKGSDSKQFEGRMAGTGANAAPNKGIAMINKPTSTIKASVDAKMGHPMKTGKGNPA